jgi:hypothetical protein
MASSNDLVRFFVAVLIGFSFSSMGCAATEVHQQGGSTAVIEQSGGSEPSRTQVTKTPNGQKIITRDGNSSDVTIQSNRPSGKGTNGAAKPQVDSDRFNRSSVSSRDCVDCPAPGRFRETDIPTAKEYKDSIRDRMRPLLPKQ